ncbi:flagellar hook-basal body complex protein FliE [Candidatus Pacearchaeota archaeon]|nr:MAG: flagellar hook-basal body complex protein FliE [Candidatus Pacearchaeota archaeon]
MKTNQIGNLINLKLSNISPQKKEKLSFKDLLLNKLKEVDKSQKKATQILEALAKEKDMDLTDVVLTISKVEIELRLLLKIRNKIIDAYQEIMRMQI